jgi:hypothetical protein
MILIEVNSLMKDEIGVSWRDEFGDFNSDPQKDYVF